MKIKFAILPLILVTALFLAGGCTDKGDPAWGEKQKALLEELLNKPNVTYGDLVIDHQKKQWVITNLEFSSGDSAVSPNSCTIESVTGVDVALEPLVQENGLLAERLELKGLVCRGAVDEGSQEYIEFKQDSLVVENLKGSKELQEAILNFGEKASLAMLKQASMDGLTLAGLRLVMDGAEGLSLEHFSLKNMANGFVGPVELKNFVFAPDAGEFDSLSIGFMGVKKMGSQALFDELVTLQKDPSLTDFAQKYVAFSQLTMKTDYSIEGLEYKDIVFSLNETVPPITIKKMTGSASFDGAKGSSSSKLENLTITPETMQFLAPGPLKSYAFKPVDLSGGADLNVVIDGKDYTLDYKNIHFADPSYGNVNLALLMTMGLEMFDPSNPSNEDLQNVKVSSAALSLEDKGLTDTIFEIASILSGSGVNGAQSMRMMSSAGLKLQCAQFPSSLQKACNDTADFLEQKGRIEYSFAPEQPLVMDNSLMNNLGTIAIESKFVPAK